MKEKSNHIFSKKAAYFIQTSNLISSYHLSPLFISKPIIENNDIVLDAPVFYILSPGIYKIQYRIYVPKKVKLTTSFFLEKEENYIEGSEIKVEKNLIDEPVYINNFVFTKIDNISGICLKSSSKFKIFSDFPAQTLAGISFEKIEN